MTIVFDSCSRYPSLLQPRIFNPCPLLDQPIFRVQTRFHKFFMFIALQVLGNRHEGVSIQLKHTKIPTTRTLCKGSLIVAEPPKVSMSPELYTLNQFAVRAFFAAFWASLAFRSWARAQGEGFASLQHRGV